MKHNRENKKAVNIILAILISVGLWLYVVNAENPVCHITLRDIPVQIEGTQMLTDNGLTVTDVRRKSMDVEMSGRKKTFLKLSKKNVVLTADVSDLTEEGEWQVPCKTVFPSSITADSVNVTHWDTLKVAVTVEKLEKKTIPVIGEFIGTEAENFQAGQVSCTPSTLEISGSHSVLEEISYALVQVTGEDVRETLYTEQPVLFMSAEDEPVDFEGSVTNDPTAAVQVTVPVQKVVTVPLTVDFLPGGGAAAGDVSYSIAPSEITLAANADAVIPETVSLGSIDLAEIMGETSLAMPIRLPEGVVSWEMPEIAFVSVSLERLASRAYTVTDLSLTHIPSGWEAKPVQDAMTVLVRGDPAQVSRLKAEQISVTADLSKAELKTGVQRVPVEVTLQSENTDSIGVVGKHLSIAVRLER